MRTSTPPLPAPATPAGQLWPVIWRRSDVVLGLVALFAGLVVVIAFIVITIDSEEEAATDLGGAIATLAFEVWIGATVLLLASARGFSFRQLGYVRPLRWGLIAVAVIGSYAAIATYFAVVVLIESFGLDLEFLREGNTIPTTGGETVALWIILGTAVVVVAPLSEEVFFRGLLFRAFVGDAGGARQRLLAIWLSGLAFSAFHLNPSVLVPFTLVGALFAYVFRESRSLWTSTAAHAIFNGVNFAATLIDRA